MQGIEYALIFLENHFPRVREIRRTRRTCPANFDMHNFQPPCASQAGTSLVTTLIGINNRKFTLLSMFFMKVDHHTEKFAHFWPILKPILDGPKMIP